MKFYDDTKPLYLETDASRIGIRGSTTSTVGQHWLPKRAWHQITQFFDQSHLWAKSLKVLNFWNFSRQPKKKSIHHNIPLRLWEVVRADVLHFNNKSYLYVVDYNSKFPIVKRLEGLEVLTVLQGNQCRAGSIISIPPPK